MELLRVSIYLDNQGTYIVRAQAAGGYDQETTTTNVEIALRDMEAYAHSPLLKNKLKKAVKELYEEDVC